jgi:hypothetical protein
MAMNSRVVPRIIYSIQPKYNWYDALKDCCYSDDIRNHELEIFTPARGVSSMAKSNANNYVGKTTKERIFTFFLAYLSWCKAEKKPVARWEENLNYVLQVAGYAIGNLHLDQIVVSYIRRCEIDNKTGGDGKYDYYEVNAEIDLLNSNIEKDNGVLEDNKKVLTIGKLGSDERDTDLTEKHTRTYYYSTDIKHAVRFCFKNQSGGSAGFKIERVFISKIEKQKDGISILDFRAGNNPSDYIKNAYNVTLNKGTVSYGMWSTGAVSLGDDIGGFSSNYSEDHKNYNIWGFVVQNVDKNITGENITIEAYAKNDNTPFRSETFYNFFM